MGKRGPAPKLFTFFNERVMEPSVGCRIWPFGRTLPVGGYGLMRVDGKTVRVHVEACRRWHGEQPPGKQAAHRCGNTDCWAGEHLYWATQVENEADKVAHGTRLRGSTHPMVKLTADDVREIRRRSAAGEIGSVLARQYDVTHANILRIVQRKTWAWLD